jgi:hypothetical protein
MISSDKQDYRDKLLQTGLTLARNSIAVSTQRAYLSTWKKWVVFMHTCHHNPSPSQVNCTHLDHDQLLQLLLMFVSYCVDIIHKAPPSVPGILSALRYQLNMQYLRKEVMVAFDHPLLAAAKAGVARMPYEPQVRLPCTYEMIQYIVHQNTQDGFQLNNLVIAVGVSMAYHLCLRASEYASRTKIPNPESHQFDSQSVEFQCIAIDSLVPSYSMQNISWHRVKLIKFTIQHAKNIRSGFGIPISFDTNVTNPDALSFLQLVYLWAHISSRTATDPFLSYRSAAGTLHCLVYAQVQQAITSCAKHFNFNPKWFKPHCVRMAAPTALRAAGGSDGQILSLGRWKSIPTSLVYQGPSTKSNNNVLQLISDPTLFTSNDVVLSRILPSTGKNRQPRVRRF